MDEDKEKRHKELIQEHEILAVLLRPLNCVGNLDLGDDTLSYLHPTIRALIPPLTTDDTPPPELDPVDDLRRDVLEALLILTRSDVGESEMTSTRNVLPLMESHYGSELEVDLTKLNQYVTGSLIIASDDSEEEGDMDFTEAVKNFKPGFM